ncbi:MAG: DUF559 domain-containing protein [Chloroflexota bacterium]|nr:DUF559 domain-containing protein [Chloroflexota bacterium]
MSNREKRHRIHPEIRKRARELRQDQTPAENKLWHILRNRNLSNYKFRRQHPIYRFITDFYCAQTKLVIEIDGDVHAMQEEYDQARTEWLKECGYTVIRFTNREVLEQTNTVAKEILMVCDKIKMEDN